MFKRILYAAENDEGVPRSLQYVRDIALGDDAEVLVLRVGEVSEEGLAMAKKYDPDVAEVTDEAGIEARIEGRLASTDVAVLLREAGVLVTTLTRSGRIGDEIIKAAEEADVDLLVVGSKPRTAIGALLTGNPTDEIVRRSRWPVLVIPRMAPEPPADTQ